MPILDDPLASSRILRAVDGQRTRRRGLKASGFTIRQNGVVTGVVSSSNGSLSFVLDEDAMILEAYTHDHEGELLVATHVLDQLEDGAHAPSNGIARFGRYTLRFDIVVAVLPAGGQQAFCTVESRERRPLLAWWPARRRFVYGADSQNRIVLPLAAAAIVALALMASLLVQNRRLRTELTQARIERDVSAPTNPPVAAGPPTFIVSATLLPGTLRGAGTPQPSVRVPTLATSLELTLLLERDNYTSGYAAVVETVAGEPTARVDTLKSESASNGERSVVVRVSAESFRNEDYLIRLSGIRVDDRIEPVADYTFRVVRPTG